MSKRIKEARCSLLKTVLPGAEEMIWNNLTSHLGLPCSLTRFLTALSGETAVNCSTAPRRNR